MPSRQIGDEDAASVPADSNGDIHVRVILLDGSHLFCSVKPSSLAGCVYEDVCRRLSLEQEEYFGLEYVDSKGGKMWLDLRRPMNRQALLPLTPRRLLLQLWLAVKFYSPAIDQLLLLASKRLFLLQLLRDFSSSGDGQGPLVCCSNPQCLAGNLLLDACSVVSAVHDPAAVSSTPTNAPGTAAVHAADSTGRNRAAVSPASSTATAAKTGFRNLGFAHSTVNPMYAWGLEGSCSLSDTGLNTGRSGEAGVERAALAAAVNCERYGVKPYLVQNENGVEMELSVIHSGLLVLHEGLKTAQHDWPLIRKLSFKRTKLLIKLYRPPTHSWSNEIGSVGKAAVKKQAVVVFRFGSRDECKHFWKLCVEYHGFFVRPSNSCLQDQRSTCQPPRSFSILSRGSSFRFNGLTQLQLAQSIKSNPVSTSSKSSSLRHFNSLQLPGQRSNVSSGAPLIDLFDYKSLSLGTAVSSHYSRQPRFAGHVSPESAVSQFNDPTRLLLPVSAGSQVTDPIVSGRLNYVNVRSGATCEPIPETQTVTESSDCPVLAEVQDLACLNYHPSGDESVEHLLQQLIFTERTFKRDLNLIDMFVKRVERVCGGASSVQAVLRMLVCFRTIRDEHDALLTNLELLPNSSDSSSIRSLLAQLDIRCHQLHKGELMEMLTQHDTTFHTCPGYRQACESFESEDQCYLPLMHLLLKPALRLARLQSTLTSLGVVCDGERGVPAVGDGCLASACDRVKLHELRRDLVGLGDWPGLRGFLLEGCLQQITRRASHHRMVFLMSDVLVCAWLTSASQFRVEERISLRDVTVAMLSAHSQSLFYFAVRCSHQMNSEIVFAASSERQRSLWIRAIQTASSSANSQMSGSLKDSNEIPREVSESVEENGSKRLALSECVDLPEVATTNSHACTGDIDEDFADISGIIATDSMLRNQCIKSVDNREYMSSGQYEGVCQGAPSGTTLQCTGGVSPAAVPLTPPTSLLADTDPLGDDACTNNRSSHVCWRRGILHSSAAVTDSDVLVLYRHLLAECSGWLMRKFRHGDVWQRLWVVLASSCLFFFRSHQDRAPLTSLPLLGYVVTPADDVVAVDAARSDGGQTRVVSHVLSLSYRQHRYLFAAESGDARALWLHQLTLAAGSPVPAAAERSPKT